MKKKNFIRRFFEKKLLKNSSVLDVWLTYIYFEIKNRSFKHLSNLFYRFLFRFKDEKNLILEKFNIKKKNFLFSLFFNFHKISFDKFKENLLINLFYGNISLIKNLFMKKKNTRFSFFDLKRLTELEIKFGNVEYGKWLLEKIIINANIRSLWRVFFSIKNICIYLKDYQKNTILSKKNFLKTVYSKNNEISFLSALQFFFFSYIQKNLVFNKNKIILYLRKNRSVDFYLKPTRLSRKLIKSGVLMDIFRKEKKFNLKKKQYLLIYKKNLNLVLSYSTNLQSVNKKEIHLEIEPYDKIFFSLSYYVKFIDDSVLMKIFFSILRTNLYRLYYYVHDINFISLAFLVCYTGRKILKKS